MDRFRTRSAPKYKIYIKNKCPYTFGHIACITSSFRSAKYHQIRSFGSLFALQDKPEKSLNISVFAHFLQFVVTFLLNDFTYYKQIERSKIFESSYGIIITKLKTTIPCSRFFYLFIFTFIGVLLNWPNCILGCVCLLSNITELNVIWVKYIFDGHDLNLK